MIIFIKNSRLNNNGNGGSDVNDADVVYRLDGQTVSDKVLLNFVLFSFWVLTSSKRFGQDFSSRTHVPMSRGHSKRCNLKMYPKPGTAISYLYNG